jgi:hypothetical protein
VEYLQIDPVTQVAVGGVFTKHEWIDPSEYVDYRAASEGAQIGWTWKSETSSWTSPEAPLVSVEEVRKERNSLLASTDFTQLQNSSLTDGEVASWATYRQALRDMPATYVPVADPTYPLKD